MGSNRFAGVMATVVLAMLAACGGESSNAASDSEQSTNAADAEQVSDAIRQIDFSAQTWLDTPRDTSITLTGSEPVGDVLDGGLYSMGEEPVVYADVNDDGFDDALASLSFVEGNGLSLVWYVWLWDPETEAPTQIPDPIAETARCATVVSSVAAGDGAFVINEKHRNLPDIGECDDDPPNKVTRTISIDDGHPVQQEGYGGYGGNCPQPQAGDADAYLIDDTRLFVAPQKGAAEVTGPDLYSYYALNTDAHPYLNRDDWALVGFGPNTDSAAFDEYGPYVPCAWAPVPQ